MKDFTCKKCRHEFDYKDSLDKFNLPIDTAVCPKCVTFVDDKTIAEYYTSPKPKHTLLEFTNLYNKWLEDNVSYMATGLREDHAIEWMEY